MANRSGVRSMTFILGVLCGIIPMMWILAASECKCKCKCHQIQCDLPIEINPTYVVLRPDMLPHNEGKKLTANVRVVQPKALEVRK